jgi:hypothetical protein
VVRVRLVLAALLVAIALWGVALHGSATLIGLDARARESAWRHPPRTPWHWALAPQRDVVWPGSGGFELHDSDDGLAGRVVDGVADLSIALRGERLDPRVLSAATLRVHSGRALRLSLSGENADGTQLLGSTQIAAGEALARIPLHASSDAPLDSLRLRIDGAPGAELRLRDLALLATPGASLRPCASARDPDLALAACDAPLALLEAPSTWRPESVLAWRDRLLLERPAAVVRPPAALPEASGFVAAAVASAGPWMFWLLAVLPLLGAALSHAMPRTTRARALLELALVCGPWLTLLWCGWPNAADDAAPMWTFLTCLLGALLLRDPTPGWRWRGDAAAWRAAAQVAAVALLVLAGAALANALDADGWRARLPGGEDYLRYPLWALLQQCILMRSIAPRARQVFGSAAGAALAAGALFGLLHLPNLSLMLATFAAGSAWVWLGYRHRALLPLAATHALLGLVLMTVAPSWLLRSAEIGGRFLIAP